MRARKAGAERRRCRADLKPGEYPAEHTITSPTRVRVIKNLGGPDVAALIWDRIEEKRKAA